MHVLAPRLSEARGRQAGSLRQPGMGTTQQSEVAPNISTRRCGVMRSGEQFDRQKGTKAGRGEEGRKKGTVTEVGGGQVSQPYM